MSGGASLTVEHSTVKGNGGAAAIAVDAGSGEPTLCVDASILGDALEIAGGTGGGARAVKGSVLAQHLPAGVNDLGGNVVGAVDLDGSGRPAAGSIGIGRGPR